MREEFVDCRLKRYYGTTPTTWLVQLEETILCEVRLQMLFKDMNFSEPFQTDCIRVTFGSVEKSHKSTDFFLSHFPIEPAF